MYWLVWDARTFQVEKQYLLTVWIHLSVILIVHLPCSEYRPQIYINACHSSYGATILKIGGFIGTSRRTHFRWWGVFRRIPRISQDYFVIATSATIKIYLFIIEEYFRRDLLKILIQLCERKIQNFRKVCNWDLQM